jgi:hypothetical protein
MRITAFFLLIMYFLPLPAQKVTFQDVTEKAGLIEPLKGIMGHGAAWGDINNDGYPDLFVGTFSDRPDSIFNVRGHSGGPRPDKLFLNNGNGTFTEVKNSPVNISGRNSGAAFADFDNDGDLDLVTSHQSYEGNEHQKPNNYLFENDGKGNFKDVTEKSGLKFGWPFTGRNTFVFDYDGDGLLDLLMQEDYVRADVSGGYSRLMKNNGNLTFTEVTEAAGLPYGYRNGFWGLGGYTGDINNDGWPDIFFAHSCRMFINNKNGTFHEVEFNFVEPRTRFAGTINPDWTCGADLGDLDNDGDMDMIIGDHIGIEDSINHRLYILLNQGNDQKGNPVLREVSAQAGIGRLTGRAPHVQIADLDNDGLPDLMVSRADNLVFHNTGVVSGIPKFEKGTAPITGTGIGYWASAPLADFNRDGRLDFFGADWEPGVHSPLLENVTPSAQNYLGVKLELSNSKNRNGIGAKVEIFKKGMLGKKEGLIAVKQISITNGYSSGYEAISYFGLPKDKVVDIRVTMPCGGKELTAKSVKRNQVYVLR